MPKGIKGFQKGCKIWLGRKHKKETIKRISESIKKGFIEGRKSTCYWLGKKISEEHKRKISLAHKGTKKPWAGKSLTEEGRKNMSKNKIGNKNPNWKGELCKEEQKRHDPKYIWWVREVKKRDKNICQLKDENCFGYNIVHHIKGWEQYPKLRYEINNGITLCQFHHPLKRKKEQKLIPFFQSLVEVIRI